MFIRPRDASEITNILDVGAATVDGPEIQDLRIRIDDTELTGDSLLCGTVSWSTATAATAARVTIGAADGVDEQTVYARAVTHLEAGTGVTRHRYRTRLVRLRPGRTYRFQVTSHAGAPVVGVFRIGDDAVVRILVG